MGNELVQPGLCGVCMHKADHGAAGVTGAGVAFRAPVLVGSGLSQLGVSEASLSGTAAAP